MKTIQEIKQIVETFCELDQTIDAAHFVMEQYGLSHPNLKGFELREKAEPNFILMTTEGSFGEPQIIRIPENTFTFPLELMLTLLAHEMVHVQQKQKGFEVLDKNEREWQAYYEMLFHKIYPQIPDIKTFNKISMAKKGLEYYNRMGENSDLQKKYAQQKQEIENLLVILQSEKNVA